MGNQKCYIGWDVGAWNCDKNKSSRDAIVILDSNGKLLGFKRGNLRESITNAQSTNEILIKLFQWCGLSYFNEEIVMAIDTPLGFSEAFVKLITHYSIEAEINDFQKNPYLYRKSEHFLFEKEEKPLSAVNHMIGAQATKGIHFLSKFAPIIESLGIWKSSNRKLTVIETYPTANNEFIMIPEILKEKLDNSENENINQDVKDAYICAEIAKRFDQNKGTFYQPLQSIHEKEGWIWVLKKNK